MKTYDYRQKTDPIDELHIAMDNLTAEEAKAALASIEDKKKEIAKIRLKRSLNWFYSSILPVIKDFSERTSSVLCVEKPDGAIFVVTIQNKYGLEISTDYIAMQKIFIFADHIGLNIRDGIPSLSLIFDCSKLMV